MADDRYAGALDRVLQLVVFLSEDMEQSLAQLGLSGARAKLVWLLQEHGPMTQRDLAQAAQVTPRNITGLVDGLVSSGFVTREPHPSDRRATLVTFTEKGAAVARSLKDDHQKLGRQLFAGMPTRRLDSFVAGLDVVMEKLYAAAQEHAAAQLQAQEAKG